MSDGPQPVPVSEIAEWLNEAKAGGAAFVVIKTDTFDYTTYPIYVSHSENVRTIAERVEDVFTKTMEVYDLSLPLEPQLAEHRAYHLGSEETP